MAPPSGQSKLLSLLHPTRYAPIRDRLLAHLDTHALRRLCATSKELRECAMSTWDINAKLSPFFDDPVAFRSELGRCDALMAGEFALRFFACAPGPGHVLDVYVEAGERLREMDRFVAGVGGYELTAILGNERKFQVLYPMPPYVAMAALSLGNTDFLTCRTYAKRDRMGVWYVRLVGTEDIPVRTILRGATSVSGINFISWNKAFSMFPLATLHDDEPAPLDDRFSLGQGSVVQYPTWRTTSSEFVDVPMYSFHDVPMYSFHDVPMYSFHDVSLQKRRVGDRRCWLMALDTMSVEPSSMPDYVLETCCFQTRGSHRCSHETIQADLFQSGVLRYRYTAVNNDEKWDRLRSRLDRREFKQLKGLVYQRYLAHGRLSPRDILAEPPRVLTFGPEENWKYMDDKFSTMVRNLPNVYILP